MVTELARKRFTVQQYHQMLEVGLLREGEPIELIRGEIVYNQSDFYESNHPQATDIFLLVEVADPTLETDRNVKIPLYAEDGISEVWLVDLNGEQIEVFRQPAPSGYQDIKIVRWGQTISPQAFPEISLEVAQILGLG